MRKESKYKATSSQKVLASKVMAALGERKMVMLKGREDGKTRVHYSIVGALGIYDIRTIHKHLYPHGDQIVVPSRHTEDPEVIILPGVRVSGYTIDASKAQRRVMEHCGLGVARWCSQVELQTRWNKFLVDLYERNIVLSLAIDNAELLPGRAFGVIKELNEWQVEKMDVGISAMFAGQTHRMKCDGAHLRHMTEFQVGKIGVEEMLQMVQTHFPIEAPSFTRPVLERIAKEETVLDMIHLARRLVETKKENRLPKIDNDVLLLAKAA